ncbi:hypothetical protein TWF481_006738 [Arthrobotrys musiformis]|uniref:Uncharacterized protein n=1 Tax=Arthrobotrys musiformis TaxID=47236 RepID=A0AAV9WAD7_9PEZI
MTGLQQLIIARAEGGTRPKTKRIADDVVLMYLPPGYELNNKLKLSNSLLPAFGELSVLYIDDPKHAVELIELVRLRAASPLVNDIPPTRREKPLPPHNEHPENIKYIGDFLDDEEDTQASQYRHVMGRIHEVIITGLLKYVGTDPPNDKARVLAYLQNLGHASPVWEERARKLLVEEHQVLQDMIKEIRGGWLFFQHFLSSNMITAAQWERLVITAMAETVRKSPVLRDYHMTAYDVSVDHFVHGKVGETLLTALNAWRVPLHSVDDDTFRINSPFMTSRKHPMQRLDELGEKFFRKLTNTYQSGETLYTRAVFCRSILTTYFFQSFISVWDECLLNGHLQGLKGLVPIYPRIIDRLREYMSQGSCPRESHPDFKNTTKKLTQSETVEEHRVRPSKSARILVVQAAISEDVEMVDAGPLSDGSSETVIQKEERRLTTSSVSKEEDKRRKRRDKRKQMRRATLITIEEKPVKGSAGVGGREVTQTQIILSEAPINDEAFDTASNLSQVANEAPLVEIVKAKSVINPQTQSILDDLSTEKGAGRSKQPVLATTESEGGADPDPFDEKGKLLLHEPSVGGRNNIKNRAKKERRKARAASLAALQQIEQKLLEEEDVAVNPPNTNIVLAPASKQSKKKNQRNPKGSSFSPKHRSLTFIDACLAEKLEPVQQKEDALITNTSLPSVSVVELSQPSPQKQESKMPRRAKTVAKAVPCTVPGASFVQPTVVGSKKPDVVKSQASTPSKPDTDLYDDPEAIAAGIKASQEEEESWTKVGGKKHEPPKHHKFMEMRGLRSAGHGHNAIFPNNSGLPRPPPPQIKPQLKGPATQAKPVTVQNQSKAGRAQNQGKNIPSQGQTKVGPPQGQVKATQPPNQVKAVQTSNQVRAAQVPNQVRVIQVPNQVRTTQVPNQAKATQIPNKVKATQTLNQAKVIQVSNQVKAIQPPNQLKATQVPGQVKAIQVPNQPRASQNQGLSKPDAAKSPTPNKNPVPKENECLSGKPSRPKRETRILVINSMKEFPTLATSTMLLSRQKDAQSTGERSIDMTVELASNGTGSSPHTKTAAASVSEEVKASDQGSHKKKKQIISLSPTPAVGPAKVQKKELPVVAQVVKAKKSDTAAPKPAIQSVVKPLAVKSQVQKIESKAGASITEAKQKATPTASTSTTPSTKTPNQGIVVMTSLQLAPKALTKKERRALAKKSAEEQKTPKLSIKERAELRRSLENKKTPQKTPQSDEKTEAASGTTVTADEGSSIIESPAITHAGTPDLPDESAAIVKEETSAARIESPGIAHPGASEENGVGAPPEVDEGFDPDVTMLPPNPAPDEVVRAAAVYRGEKINVEASYEAASIFRGRAPPPPPPRAVEEDFGPAG